MTDLAGWRGLISEALALGRFSLAQFPVLDSDGRLMHIEAPVRMRHPREDLVMTAGDVLPWATRCGLLPLIDEAVSQHALALIEDQSAAVCINLSTESMCHADTVRRLAEQLRLHPQAAQRLWIDLPESAAFRHGAAFRALCHQLKPLGCKVGLEHVSQQVCRIGELHDVGLDYLKISASMVRDIGRTDDVDRLAVIVSQIPALLAQLTGSGMEAHHVTRIITSVADALRVYASEMRDKRVMRAEEAANKLPTKMTLATMMLTVPPLLVILVGPSANGISKLGKMGE